ncbi:MAG: hypothetical protein EOP19_23550 [Hyphomicrobiales bacterium]|nr:MAG: hypothetical protein EOP19_23550 [Hyphomicrobiales bacterium]
MTQPPTFEPVNMVEQQLMAAANGDAQAQKAFERFILDETLFVATPEAPAEETSGVIQADTAVKLLNVPLNDGRQAAAVFTSPQRVYEAFGEVGYIGLQGRILFEMIRQGPAALNPGQSYGVIWEPESLSGMLGLPVERVIQKETQLMLGYPADPPVELIQRLEASLSTVSGVEAVWLALAMWPEDQSQTWYLDVRTHSPDREPIQRALGVAVEGADLKGRPIDMAVRSPAEPEGAGIVVIAPKGLASPPAKKGWLSKLFG